MTGKAAIHAILLSATIMGGIYAWRWLTNRGKLPHASGLSAAKLIGYGPQVSPEGFLIAWGIVYGGLSVLSMALPGLAGSMALLILLTGAIANFGSASETALGLVKLKTGTTPSGPEETGQVPAGAVSSAFEGQGSLEPLTRPGEVAPSKLAPSPSSIRVKTKPSINWKRLEYLIRHGGPKGHVTPAGLKEVTSGALTLSQLESKLGI